ncbi:PEP-CTERM sorting domain-containing protein [Luteolibacter algae]|uniref:PEP-CTERM sorting domain-containing protein n=1 Tax=Luteolibacter algae TaxID=454151 RepID=A0ABW5DET0_9BACT
MGLLQCFRLLYRSVQRLQDRRAPFMWEVRITGFLAFRILKEDGWHYGWLEVSGGAFGLSIHGIAWETDPDKAIVAGAVPEPTSALIVICGAICFLIRRKRFQ